MTINDRIQKLDLTDKEQLVLQSVVNLSYAEPGYSDFDVRDIAIDCELSVPQVKGVISSLSQKGYVDADMGSYDKAFAGLIYLSRAHWNLNPEWDSELEARSNFETKETK